MSSELGARNHCSVPARKAGGVNRLPRLYRVVAATYTLSFVLSCGKHPDPTERQAPTCSISAPLPLTATPAPSIAKISHDGIVDMIRIPAGKYSVGTAGKHDHPMVGLPRTQVELSSFEVDRTEVTVASYTECVRASVCTTESLADNFECNWGKLGRDTHPINCVTFKQANAFCHWKNKRLPTDVEWEVALYEDLLKNTNVHGFYYDRACTNGESPVGCPNSPRDKSKPRTCPVGTHPFAESHLGIQDIFGSVAEWTSGRYCNWKTNWCDSNVVRGMAWCANAYEELWMRRVGAEAKAPESSTAAPQLVGFRCAR